jgi:hypothetical protein
LAEAVDVLADDVFAAEAVDAFGGRPRRFGASAGGGISCTESSGWACPRVARLLAALVVRRPFLTVAVKNGQSGSLRLWITLWSAQPAK